PILAKPADLCCLKGSFHTGEPQGKTTHIEGIETYIAAPAPDTANGNILLYFPDAFGLHGNSFLLMDAFASCGYMTLGDAVSKHTTTPLIDPNFDFEAWCGKHLESSEEVAAKWVEAVESIYGGPEKVKFACVDGICKAGAIAHPSFMKESHVFGVDAPLYIAAPTTDSLFLPESRARTVEILTEGEKRFNLQVYSGVGHGFAWAKEQCFKGFVEWFDFWLSRD
ncbi:unnamed protein product, partial [Aureobasidium pullulans]